MKISTRNQLKGKVSAITEGVVNAEVVIDLDGGGQLVSTITLGSVKNLGLKNGSVVIALVKASNVMVGVGIKHISARNVLVGKVSAIEEGAINTEVDITFGKSTVVAIITKASVQAMELKLGSEAAAIIKASSVMIAVE